MLRRLSGAVAIACLTLPAFAASVRIRLADGVTAAETVAGTIECTAANAPFTIVARETTIDVPPCAGSELAVRANGWWGAAAPGDRTLLLLWPRATLRGTMDGAIAAVNLRIESDGRFSPVNESCEVRERSWQCSAPAGVALHVRLAADDAIPLYFFDVIAPHDLGTQQLVRGASIAGYVDGMRDAVVELTAEGKPVASRKANAHGFFQFTDVPHGALRVTSRGAAPVEVRIRSATETVLPQRLRPVPLVAFELAITPPADRDGIPWRVELARRAGHDRGASLLHSVSEGTASPDGRWTASVEPGEYALAIRDTAGSVQHAQDVTIGADAAPLLVAVHQVPVRGTVTLGGEPVEATLTLSGERGRSVRIDAGSDGAFQGVLPEEGEWNVTVHPLGTRQLLRRRAVEIRRAAGAEHARVDLDFPGGRIEGEVVDESGRAVAANLTLVRDGRIDASGGTEEDGTFSIVGLQPGSAFLLADAKEGTSAPVACTIERDRKTADVRVVVLKRTEIEARIETTGGAPIAGAVVSYFAPTFLERREAVSGPSGRITLDLPSQTPRVTLVVIAPGFARKLVTLAVDQRSPRIVLGEAAGILRVRFPGGSPWPWIRGGGTDFVSLASFYVPGRMRDVVDRRGFFAAVEPGAYTICPAPGATERCVHAVVTPGGETLVDATEPAG